MHIVQRTVSMVPHMVHMGMGVHPAGYSVSKQ